MIASSTLEFYNGCHLLGTVLSQLSQCLLRKDTSAYTEKLLEQLHNFCVSNCLPDMSNQDHFPESLKSA